MNVDKAKSKPTDPKEEKAFKIEPYSFPDGMYACLLFNIYRVTPNGTICISYVTFSLQK